MRQCWWPGIDPVLVATRYDPSHQVFESWRKISLYKSGITVFQGAFFVIVFEYFSNPQEGHLYILRGEKSITGPFYLDFWPMDFEALNEWDLPIYRAEFEKASDGRTEAVIL
ncbi:hypothetical protein B0H19DRAFT_1263410 [Mycena capillaripes]|nr:hypothetical protein B0H19DRAFT_1263410 [Mycena capillaripes]